MKKIITLLSFIIIGLSATCQPYRFGTNPLPEDQHKKIVDLCWKESDNYLRSVGSCRVIMSACLAADLIKEEGKAPMVIAFVRIGIQINKHTNQIGNNIVVFDENITTILYTEEFKSGAVYNISIDTSPTYIRKTP